MTAPRAATRRLWLTSAALSLIATHAAAQGAAAPTGTAVEEIIVTAQRREERLQDVPASISAFSSGMLERAGIESTKELTQVTPGLNFTQSSYSPQPTIRGIGTRGVSAGDESVVPVYVDGVYQPVLSSTVIELNNIERIEVLKGPQGALLGRNATGGAINVITRTPSADPSADLSLSYGRFNEVVAKAYATRGFGPVAADLAILASKDDGYIRNIAKGEDQGSVETFSIRSKLLVEPTDGVDLTLTLGHVHTVDSTPYATQPQNGNTIARRFNPRVLLPSGPYETSALNAGALKTFQNYAAFSAVWKLPSVELHSITGLQYNELSAVADSDGTPQDVGVQSYTNYARSIYQDFYAVSDLEGPFSWIAGVTLYKDTAGGKGTVQTLRSFPSGALSTTSSTGRVRTESIALWFQAGYDLTEALNLTVGGRYTQDKKTFWIRNNVSAATLDAEKTWSKFTPTATLKYTVSPELNVYAKAGQAFKAGIFPSTTFSTRPVNPETVTQYEVGLKAEPLPWLRANLAAYFTDYKNVQVNVRDPVTLVSTLENAAAAEIYGLEGELFATPMQGLNIRAGFSLLHGEYKEYKNAQITVPTGLGGSGSATIDASGKTLIRTPDITANLGFDYTRDALGGEVTWSANAFYSGESYWEASNRVREAPYTIVNSEISWLDPSRRYRFAVWGENLLDEAYSLFVLSSTTADSQVFARPRTFGIRLSVSLD